MCCFVNPRSASGLATPCSRAACAPGRQSERSSAFVPSATVSKPARGRPARACSRAPSCRSSNGCSDWPRTAGRRARRCPARARERRTTARPRAPPSTVLRVGRASTDDRQHAIGPERQTRRDREVGGVHPPAKADGDLGPSLEPGGEVGFPPHEAGIRRDGRFNLHDRAQVSRRDLPSRAWTQRRAPIARSSERLTRQPPSHRLEEPIEARGDLPPIAATLKNELKRERARRPSRSGIFCIQHRSALPGPSPRTRMPLTLASRRRDRANCAAGRACACMCPAIIACCCAGKRAHASRGRDRSS